MKVCTNCVLPETFPGISFNEKGKCNFCLDFKGQENVDKKKAEYCDKFEALLKEHKGKSCYDALMCYSGGKDSTYTMALLKQQYDLKMLAITFDNGFVPQRTFDNVRNVAENLGVDHVIFKPRFDVLAKIFRACAKTAIYPPKTLERASTICTSCMAIIKFTTLRFALEKDVPMITFGWSPGQAPITSSIMKNNHQMVKMMQRTVFDPIHKVAGDDVLPYFLEEKHFSKEYNFPYNVNPLAFLEYDEEEIYRSIGRLGWEAPKEVDANSTNCLLNSFGNQVHKKQCHFHPYSFELANLVREGNLDRAVALERLNSEEDPRIVSQVKRKLKISGKG